MNEITQKDKKTAHLLLLLLVISWGFEYVVAKKALEAFEPVTLLNVKYVIGFVVVMLAKLAVEPKTHIRRKDIPLFILCAVAGDIIYFYCEYAAMDYMPIALITIMLSFVPGVSILMELAIYKKKPTKLMVLGILVCVLGIAMIIGADLRILLRGRLFGYILCFAAILAWNCYNFITAALTERYTSITLTATQLLCTILLTMPYAVCNFPPMESFNQEVLGGVIYLGIVSAGIGFLISVRGLRVLGPTTSALYSNFLPVTSAFFGWLFLKETVSLPQLMGGIIVVGAGYLVIKEKGKLEEQIDERDE